MKLLASLLALFAVPALALAATASEIDAQVATYNAAGKAVVEMALGKNINAATVAAKVDAMLTSATWLAREYAKKHAKGEKLLTVVINNIEAMKKLPYKDIEHNWHDLHHFDTKDKDIGLNLKDEDNEHFTDPIHSIVHPLLVLKAAQDYAAKPNDEALKNIKEEMEEGIEQVNKTGASLKK